MTNLVERCKELVGWWNTGLLNGGEGGAMRELAAQLKASGIPDHDAMAVAEHKTHKEALDVLPELVAALEEIAALRPGVWMEAGISGDDCHKAPGIARAALTKLKG